MEYMKCNFSENRSRDDDAMKMEDHEGCKSNHFQYLELIVHKKWRIEVG